MPLPLRCALVTLLLAMPGEVAATPAFVIEAADTAWATAPTSLALDDQGDPHIAYLAPSPPWDSLAYGRKLGTTWTHEVAYIGQAITPRSVSLALDDIGNPHISFSGDGDGFLKYVTKFGGVWTIDSLDKQGNSIVGQGSSLRVDASGDPHITYYVGGIGDLWYSIKSDGVWTTETIPDTVGNVGRPSSLELDTQGNPHVSYRLLSGGDLRYAERIGGAWTFETVDASANNVGLFNSIALDDLGNVHIAYHDQTATDLKYALKSEGSWTLETVDASANDVGRECSLSLDALGQPHIAYYDFTTRDVKYATKSGGAWSIAFVDSSADDLGSGASLKLDAFDGPCLSYANGTRLDILFARAPADTTTFSGLAHGGLGQATVTTIGLLTPGKFGSSEQLIVSNIGSSGNDGVRVLFPPAQEFSTEWLDLDEGTIPDNAYFEARGAASSPGIPEIHPGYSRVTDIGATYEITADFTPIGSTTMTVEVYNGGALVARRTGLSGALARVVEWPSGASGRITTPSASPGGSAVPGVDWDMLTTGAVLIVENTLLADTTVMGDEVRIIAETPTTQVTNFSSLDIRAKDIPTITITGESLTEATAVSEPTEFSEIAPGRMTVFPNPALGGRAQVSFRIAAETPLGQPVNLAVFDVTGRLVRTLESGALRSGAGSARWDGLDNVGRPVAPGTYVFRLESGRHSQAARVILVR